MSSEQSAWLYEHALDEHATDEQTEPLVFCIEEMMTETKIRSPQRILSCPLMQMAHPLRPTPHQSLHGMQTWEQGITTGVQREERKKVHL